MGRKSLDPLDPRPYYVKRRDLTSGRVHYHCAVEGCNRKWTCDNVTRLRHHLRCDHEAFELRNVLNKRRAKSPASGRSCGTTVTPIVYDKVKPTVQEPTAPEDLQGVDQPLLESFLVPSPSSKLLGSFHLHLVKSLLAACLPNHAREWLYSVSLKDAFKMLRRGYIPLAKDEFMVLKEAAFRECLESHITELVSAAKRTGQMALILDSSYVTSGETLYSVYGSFKDERHFKVLPFGFYVLADCSEDAAKEKLGNWIKGEIWPELSSNCVRLEAVIHSGGPILEAAALVIRRLNVPESNSDLDMLTYECFRRQHRSILSFLLGEDGPEDLLRWSKLCRAIAAYQKNESVQNVFLSTGMQEPIRFKDGDTMSIIESLCALADSWIGVRRVMADIDVVLLPELPEDMKKLHSEISTIMSSPIGRKETENLQGFLDPLLELDRWFSDCQPFYRACSRMLKAYAPLMKRLKEVAPDTYDVVKERLKGATKQLSFLESFDPEGWQSIPSEKAKREKLNKATRMIRRLKLGDLEDSAKSILNYFRKSGPHAIDTLATTNCDAETYWKMFSESGSAIEKLIHRTLVAPCSLHPIETRVHPLLDRAQRFKMTSTELFESIVAGWNDRPVLAENVPSQTDAPDVDLTDSPEGKGKNFSSENTVDDSDLVIVSLDDNSSPVASSSYSPMACDDMRAEDSAHPSELSPFICEDFFTYFGEEGCRCYLLRDPPVFDKLDDKPDSILLGLPGDWGRVLKVDQKSISSRGSSFFIYFDATNEQSDLRYYASGLRDLYKARYIVFPSLSTYRAIQQAVDD